MKSPQEAAMFFLSAVLLVQLGGMPRSAAAAAAAVAAAAAAAATTPPPPTTTSRLCFQIPSQSMFGSMAHSMHHGLKNARGMKLRGAARTGAAVAFASVEADQTIAQNLGMFPVGLARACACACACVWTC